MSLIITILLIMSFILYNNEFNIIHSQVTFSFCSVQVSAAIGECVVITSGVVTLGESSLVSSYLLPLVNFEKKLHLKCMP